MSISRNGWSVCETKEKRRKDERKLSRFCFLIYEPMIFPLISHSNKVRTMDDSSFLEQEHLHYNYTFEAYNFFIRHLEILLT